MGMYGGPSIEERELEVDVRKRLDTVELVCEIDLADADLDRLATTSKRLVGLRQWDMIVQFYPASFVAYCCLKGAELYTAGTLWPHLFPANHDKGKIGLAFRDSLHRIGKSDFKQYVANKGAWSNITPLLLHGGLPAAHAVRLVDRIEFELARGLINGHDAVRRLSVDGDLALDVGQPMARLVEHVPWMAAEIVDGIVDRLTTGSTTRRLPRHIERHLHDERNTTRTMSRLRPPVIQLDRWSGRGPEIAGRQDDGEWRIESETRSFRLSGRESAVLSPSKRVDVHRKDCQVTLLKHGQWFFSNTGILIGTDEELPRSFVVVLERDDQLVDQGDTPLLPEDTDWLTGEWSGFRLCSLSADGAKAVRVLRADGSKSPEKVLGGAIDPVLLGRTNDHVFGLAGRPLYSGGLVLDSSGMNVRPRIWFDVAGPQARSISTDEYDDSGSVDVGRWLGNEVVEGELWVRRADGTRWSKPVVWAPGLEVSLPVGPLLPGETSSGMLRAPGSVTPTSFLIGPDDHEASFTFGGVQVVAALPRVRWAVQGREPQLVRYQAATVRIEHKDFLSAKPILLVRTGHPETLWLSVSWPGGTQSVSSPKPTERTGAEYCVAIDLERFRDTIRAHEYERLIIRLNVRGKALDLVELRPAGDTGVSESALPSVEWKPPVRAVPVQQYPERLKRIRDRRLRIGVDPVIRKNPHYIAQFVSDLGEASRILGASGVQPEGIVGEPDPIGFEKIRQIFECFWASDSASKLRTDEIFHVWRNKVYWDLTADSTRVRTDVARYVEGRRPPIERMAGWLGSEWLKKVMAGPRTTASDYSGVLLFSALLLAGGVASAQPVFVEAAALFPQAATDLLPVFLELVKRGFTFPVPDISLAVLEPQEVAAPPDPSAIPLILDRSATTSAPPDTGSLPSSVAPAVNRAPRQTAREIHLKREDGREQGMMVRILQPGVRGLKPWAVLRGEWSSFYMSVVVPIPPDLGTEAHVVVIDRRAPLPLSLLCEEEGANSLERFELGMAPEPPSIPPLSTESYSVARASDLLRSCLLLDASQNLGRLPLNDIEADDPSTYQAIVDLELELEPRHLDRLALMIAPIAMLSTVRGVSSTDLARIQAKSRLMAAVLAQDGPDTWRKLGWKPEPLNLSVGVFFDCVWFAHALFETNSHEPRTFVDVNYDMPIGSPVQAAVARTLERICLETSPRFGHAINVALSALQSDSVTLEATRLLLAWHEDSPTTIASCGLVALSLHLASAQAELHLAAARLLNGKR